MNKALLRAAKTLLTSQQISSFSAAHTSLAAIGYAYVAEATAVSLLHQALAEAPAALPLQGVALWQIYKNSKDKKQVKILLQELYPQVLAWHQHLYSHYDPQEEGLPYNPSESGQLQDPLFLALLVWSNENLIQIGHLLKEDVIEIIQWNELTIFSINEKLWDESSASYQAFDMIQNKYRPTLNIAQFAPMAGEVPTQEKAEQMLINFQRVKRKAKQINVFEQWLLRRGLLRYDFIENAMQLRQELLQMFTEYGFYEDFDAKTGEPLHTENGQSPLAAALAIDLLKRA